MRTEHPRAINGQRQAALFNELFHVGDLVAVRRTPGEPATWDRIFAPAYGFGDGAVVELAGSLVPVDTDLVFTCPAGLPDAPADHPAVPIDRSTAWAKLVLAFVLGAAAAVLLAIVTPPAPAFVTDATGADCDALAIYRERT